ncbi:MAG: cytochrome b [Hyphomicrobiaceae bacterium]
MPEDTRPDEPVRAFTPYSGVARFLHWLTVVLVLIMTMSGLVMVYRGKDLNIWDQLTNTLYSGHKALGLVILALIVVRLGYRLANGAPPDEPGLDGLQRFVAHLTHWAMYGLLVALPILGWLGISMFPALGTFGGIQIPALTAPDKAMSQQVLWLHGSLAYLLIVLIAMHIGAALHHHVIRGDNVLRRMLPSLKPRK